jgi:HAD superfamily hydrolase (TIGR01549 family)
MPATQWTILFDLDQTLVLTSALEALRKQRAWPQVYERLHLTTLPPGTLDFLHQVRAKAQLGIVTNTPRPYAEKLATYHRLPVPIVVAYHDTRLHKPHPEPLLTAIQKLSGRVEQCCYIGDSPHDLQAALNAKMIPIGLCWDGSLARTWKNTGQYSLCSSWSEVFTVLRQLL